MGTFLISHQPTTTTTTNFEQAEQAAFEHVKVALRDMPLCELADLEQAAFSYAAQSFASSGIPVRENYLRAKASTWAAWWFRKHGDNRTPRPHSKYSPAQALRGRVVSQYRRGAQADVAALLAQIAAGRGDKAGQIAAGIGRTVQHTRRLMRRTFSGLLVSIICGTFGKSSAVSLAVNHGIDLQEQSPNVRIDEGGGDKGPEVAGAVATIGEIERLGPIVCDILRGHWAAQSL